MKETKSICPVCHNLIDAVIFDNDNKTYIEKMMLIGIMHFQDLYNLDIDRVQRCGIHYAVPDGRVIPFCTYNTLYRTEIEKKFSRPLD